MSKENLRKLQIHNFGPNQMPVFTSALNTKVYWGSFSQFLWSYWPAFCHCQDWGVNALAHRLNPHQTSEHTSEVFLVLHNQDSMCP